MNLKLAMGIHTIAMLAVPGIGMAQDDADDSTQTATGCLQKSPTANIYLLTDGNGKTWDLRSRTVALNAHVGHTVTVSGTIPKDPKWVNIRH